MNNTLTQNRSVYRLKGTDLFMAVHEFYLRDIRESIVEYGSLENVPSHCAVKGIVFLKMNDHLCQLLYNGHEIQTPINTLEFDLGDLRISA